MAEPNNPADRIQSGPAHAEVLLAYEDSMARISELKKTHWNITYYTLSVYAAMVALSYLNGRFDVFMLIVISIPILLTAIFFIVIMGKTQDALRKRRDRLRYIQTNFFTYEGKLANKPLWADYDSPSYDDVFKWLFHIANLSGAAVALLAIWYNKIVYTSLFCQCVNYIFNQYISTRLTDVVVCGRA
jgi:hypothetical protein